MTGVRGSFAALALFTLASATAIAADESPPAVDPLALGTAGAAPGAVVAGGVATGSGTARNELDFLMQRLDDKERALRDELARLGPELELTRRRMTGRGRVYYRYLRAGLLPAGGGFDALVDHAARVERARRALERDLSAEQAITKRQARIHEQLGRLRAERAPLEVQREAMDRARVALREADERRAAFARAFEASARPPDYLAIYGAEAGPAELDARRGFAALKGRLPLPVAGRAEVRRVLRAGAGGVGLELTAARGAPVRSVAAGRVAFADRYEGYGLTAIVDHGDHYYSVYGDLASVDARVGDAMAAGTRVGTVGEEGGKPALYFELRRGAELVDPSPWLGL